MRGVWRFGPFTVQGNPSYLRQGNELIKLSQRQLAALLVLLEADGAIVCKEKFFESIWNEVYVEKGNLTQTIFLLRRTLGRRADGGEYIETLFRQGYRLVATCEEERFVPAPDPPPSAVAARSEDLPILEFAALQPEAPPLGRSRWLSYMGEVRRHPWRIGVMLLICATFGGAGRVTMEARRHPRLIRAVRLTNDGLYKEALAPLLTDGPRLYFTEISGNRNVLAEVSVWGGATTRYPAPTEASTATALSRFHAGILFDSTWEGGAEQPLIMRPDSGGEGQRLGNVRGHGAAWSPDGRHLAITSGHEVWITDKEGEAPRRLLRVEGVPYWPAWSPGGQRLRFSVDTGGAGQSLWEMDAKSGSELRPVLANSEHANQACCGRWSEDGRWFVFVVQTLCSSSLWLLDERGSFQRRQFEIASGPLDYWRAPLISADNKHIYAVGEQARGALMWYDERSRQWAEARNTPSVDTISFSRDGQWMAYSLFPEGSIWRSRRDGSARLQLSILGEMGRFPQWSPDGSRILYMGGRPGEPWRLREVAAAGGTPRTVLPEGTSQGAGTYSPNGERVIFGPVIAYGVDAQKSPGIRVVNLRTGSVEKLPQSDGLWIARWSPDGRYVAAASADRQRVMLFDWKANQWSTLADEGVNDIVWSHNGKTLFFDKHNGLEGAVYRADMTDRAVHRFVDLSSVERTGFAGWRLAITADDHVMIVRQAGIVEVYRLDVNLL